MTENIKISALDRQSLSSDLAYDDYIPFNDTSAGDQATMAITIGGLDSYFKDGVNHLARSAVSGFPTDTLTAYPTLPRLEATSITSTDGMRTNGLSANMVSADTAYFSSITADGLTANSLTAITSLSATTVSADTVSAISIYGTVKSAFNIAGTSTSYVDSLHVDGDLHVHGSTISTSAENISVKDPIIELAKDQTAPGVDFGIIGNRGGTNNGALFFDESADEWVVAFTDDEATTSGNITIASYTDFQAKDVTFNAATITDGSGIEALNATKLTSGSIPDARVTQSNVTQHQAALTILTSQVTDLSNYARAAVSGEVMTLSGTNIRATGPIDSAGSVSGLTLSGTLDAKYIDTQYLSELNAAGVADADTTFVKDATDNAQKRVTLANLKTYFSFGADIDDEARTAVSATDMFFLHAASISGQSITGTSVTAQTLTGQTITATTLSSGVVRASSVSAGTLSGTDVKSDYVEASNVSGTAVSAEGVYINGVAEANNLDNYVEGSWTPSFTFGSGSTTYAAQDGYYTRIGNLVYCTFKIEIDTLSSPDGTLTLAGLPVAAGNNTGGAGVGGVVSTSINYETNRTEYPVNTELSIQTNKNTQTANLIFSDDGVAPLDATPAMLNNGSVLEASFFYQA